MSLTAQQVTQAKPTDKIQKLFDGGGLYLEVTTTRDSSWPIPSLTCLHGQAPGYP